MKLHFLLPLFVLAQQSFAQLNPELMKANWNPGTSKVIFGNSVLRVTGNNNANGMINLAFKTKDQLLQETNETSARAKWSAAEKEKVLSKYKNSSGALYFYITRPSKEAAGAGIFTLVIKDAADKQEVLREQLTGDASPPPSGSKYWWSQKVKFLPAGLKGKYNVYILDAQGKENATFKFEVVVP